MIIVGLGNPGEKYAQTRHNVGFWVVDRMAEELDLRWQDKSQFKAAIAKNNDHLLIKPLDYMNNAGQPVRGVLNFLDLWPDKLDELYVVFDDLDIVVGDFKVQLGKGPKVHNGLLSLYQHLGTNNFWHVRVGVDGRKGERVIPSDKYVLSQFLSDEKNQVNTALEQVVEKLLQ